MADSAPAARLDERRRILRLETLYDLALALHADRSEGALIDELLLRVCAVLDPAAAVAVTRDAWGSARTVSAVGWGASPPDGDALLRAPLWHDLLRDGEPVRRRDGALAGRDYRALLATPLVYRDAYLGFFALLDKETRGQDADGGFTRDDRRFLDSVAALGGVALDNVRRVDDLEAQRARLAEENQALRGRLRDEIDGNRIVAQAPAMVHALGLVERVAPRSVNVLVRGESGTGKELIAKLIHVLSARSGPLIALNCAALPEALLESELFGIEGGVATGVQARRGKFELADGGTLFLDEIGDLQPALQVKLLRVLQEREITPLGARAPIEVDVRVVAATHRDLETMVAESSFRGDLYYRLRAVEVVLPPLRQRRQDIPLLVRHFMEGFCQRESLAMPTVDADARKLLLTHGYPGNVRELRNLVEGMVSLADGRIDAELVRSLMGGRPEAVIAPALPRAAAGAAGMTIDPTDDVDEGELLDLHTLEQRHIARVLARTGGNKSAAARLLGLDRRTLQRKGF